MVMARVCSAARGSGKRGQEVTIGEGAESTPHGLPLDMNDLDAWSELLDLDPGGIDEDELTRRAAEMSHGTFKTLLQEEYIAGDDYPFWASTLADGATSALDRLRRLQEPLYNVNLWPGWESADRNAEFLDLMWTIDAIVANLPPEPELLSETLRGLLEDPDIWLLPLAPTALIAMHELLPTDLDLVLETFVDAWDTSEDTPVYRGSIRIEAPNKVIDEVAPLLAVAVLHPAARAELCDLVLRIMTESSEENLKLAFWAYISACLTDDRRTGYWDPVAIWHEGFFTNGLPKDRPLSDSEHQLRCLNHFWGNEEILDLADPWGNHDLAPLMLTLLAKHSETPPATLSILARLCPRPEVVLAAISNPRTPEDAS